MPEFDSGKQQTTPKDFVETVSDEREEQVQQDMEPVPACPVSSTPAVDTPEGSLASDKTNDTNLNAAPNSSSNNKNRTDNDINIQETSSSDKQQEDESGGDRSPITRPPRHPIKSPNSGDNNIPRAKPSRNIPKPKHDRGESYGNQSYISAITEPPSILQPVFDIDSLPSNDNDYYFNGNQQNINGNIALVENSDVGKNHHQERFHDILPDVIENFVDPLETEAEKAILKVIENEQQGLNGNEDIGTTSLLSHAIPPNDQHAIEMFTSKPVSSVDNGAVQINKDGVATPIQNQGEETTSILPVDSVDASRAPLRRPRLGTASSVMSRRTANISVSGKKTVHDEAKQQTAPSPIESKKQTIEEALVDTGEQLKQFQIGTNPRASAEFQLGSTSEEVTPGAPTSADRFLRNAAVIGQVGGGIYQRRVGNDDDDSVTVNNDDNQVEVVNEDSGDFDIENQKKGRRSRCCFGICSGKKQKVDDNGDKENSNGQPKRGRLFRNMRQSVFHTKQRITDQAGFFQEFYKPRKKTILAYCKMVTLYVFIPTLIVSISLFYADNPAMCTSKAQKRNPEDCSSVSWFLNFLLIRQVILFSFALAIESFVIDYSITRSRFIVNLLGPRFTLWIVGSRGWPFRLFVWSLLDLCLLAGGSRFVNHWLYWQDIMPFFNANNASGNVTENDTYYNFIIIGIVVSLVTTCKRYWLGLSFGQKMYANYGKKLAKIMQDMLAISLIAKLAHDIEHAARLKRDNTTPGSLGMIKGGKDEIIFGWGADGNLSPPNSFDEDDSKSASMGTPTITNNFSTHSGKAPQSPGLQTLEEGDASISTASIATPSQMDTAKKNTKSKTPSLENAESRQALYFRKAALVESMELSQKIKISEILGEWEEPILKQKTAEKVSISEILQFRQALAFMDDVYPFSIYFGPANRRDRCAESAESVYERLMMQTPDESSLPFSTLALLAVDKNGNVDHKQVHRLRKMFRSDKHGNLTPLDFVKNCDAVYKKLRLFRASVANSSQIDEAFERIFNLSFHAIMFFVVLAILGVDTMALFLSLSSVIVGFAFMIGSASAKYFEGVLFVLARRPYDIGDRIHVSDPTQDTNPNGSSSWFVENVDLFTTTVRFATTNEVATYNNGSLASTRIINAARSPNAIVYIYMKFDTDVPQAKIKIFHKTIETFVKSRPRQWQNFSGFRATRVETDLGFIEYVIVATHVEKWQNMLPIVTSKAELASYCLEVSKQLDMKYSAPELPVTLDVKNPLDAKQMLFGGGSGGKGTDVSGFMSRERENPRGDLDNVDVGSSISALKSSFAKSRPPLGRGRSHKRVNTAFC